MCPLSTLIRFQDLDAFLLWRHSFTAANKLYQAKKNACECSENCDDKLNEFLKRTYYIDAGHDNKVGMSRLNSKMAQIEVKLFITVFESFGEHSCFIFELEILFMKFINIHFCFTGYSCSKQNILPCCSPRVTSWCSIATGWRCPN